MTGKQLEKIFPVITRCICTVVLADILWLFTITREMAAGIVHPMRYCVPLCLETLAAGLLLYVILAAASSRAIREYNT